MGRHTHDITPDCKGLVIVFVNTNDEAVGGEAELIGDEFPGPLNGFFFEVVAKAEVAQHLKKSVVTGGTTDVFDVVSTDTFLGAGCPLTGGGLLAQENRLEG